MGVAIPSCEGEELLSRKVGDGMKERSEDKRKQKRVWRKEIGLDVLIKGSTLQSHSALTQKETHTIDSEREDLAYDFVDAGTGQISFQFVCVVI